MSDNETRRVLDFWFSNRELDAPKLDSRMERWFRTDPTFDEEIRQQFGELVERAAAGELDGWADSGEGRLALIILLDQFPRNIFRGQPRAFARDSQALKLAVEGAMSGVYKTLSPIQQVFFFMPLQHAESIKIQEKSVRLFNALAEGVSETLRETFLTFAHFAELHRDIIAEFGRFPHRNEILGRTDTPAERAYLDGDAVRFGQ